MKSPVVDASLWKGSVSRIWSILVLGLFIFLPCFSVTVFNSFSSAADDDTAKAIRRNSPEAGAALKSQKRVALVIGNSDYKVGPLMNPAHDAEDVSAVLKTLGFDVQTRTNVNQREMEEAVNKFVQQIQDGDVALFYFSGHGVQVRGENYLIPIGDSIQSEPDVRYKTVNAGLILAKMEDSRNRANIVILDACRNNPFKGLFRSPSMGLTKMEAPKGTFIAYATSPDSVAADGTGRNSPYTKHLIEALKVKDIPIEQAFKLVARAVNQETGGQQIPWISSSLLDDFFCNPSHLNSSSARTYDQGNIYTEEGHASMGNLDQKSKAYNIALKTLEKWSKGSFQPLSDDFSLELKKALPPSQQQAAYSQVKKTLGDVVL